MRGCVSNAGCFGSSSFAVSSCIASATSSVSVAWPRVTASSKCRLAVATAARSPRRGLGGASLRALRRPGDGAGDDLLVDGLGQSVEHGDLEAVLGDGDVVRADRAAALLVVAPLRCRHAEPA